MKATPQHIFYKTELRTKKQGSLYTTQKTPRSALQGEPRSRIPAVSIVVPVFGSTSFMVRIQYYTTWLNRKKESRNCSTHFEQTRYNLVKQKEGTTTLDATCLEPLRWLGRLRSRSSGVRPSLVIHFQPCSIPSPDMTYIFQRLI